MARRLTRLIPYCEAVRLALPRPRDATHPAVVAAVHRILTELGLEGEAELQAAPRGTENDR